MPISRNFCFFVRRKKKPKTLKEKKILYVEDEGINALIMRKLLSSYSISVAPDSDTAKKLAEEEDFDLILIDNNLGDSAMSGIEIMKYLKQNEKYAHIPAIVLTASAMEGDEEMFLEEGFDDYISKPPDKDILLQKINLHLNRF